MHAWVTPGVFIIAAIIRRDCSAMEGGGKLAEEDPEGPEKEEEELEDDPRSWAGEDWTLWKDDDPDGCAA